MKQKLHRFLSSIAKKYIATDNKLMEGIAYQPYEQINDRIPKAFVADGALVCLFYETSAWFRVSLTIINGGNSNHPHVRPQILRQHPSLLHLYC